MNSFFVSICLGKLAVVLVAFAEFTLFVSIFRIAYLCVVQLQARRSTQEKSSNLKFVEV